MSLSRTTALIKKGACAAGVCIAALAAFAALGSAPALAWHGYGGYGYGYGNDLTGKPATAKQNAELAVCPGQTFSQPFEGLGDASFYTLVEGSEFNSPNEGWELKNGAQIVEGTRPDGSTGGVLELPGGSYAVSPPVCVTLGYPSARAWVEDVEGAGAVAASVYYANTRPTWQIAGLLSAKRGAGWELSSPFDVDAQLGTVGEEGTREVRFIFANFGHGSDYRVSGVYVDPRMS